MPVGSPPQHPNTNIDINMMNMNMNTNMAMNINKNTNVNMNINNNNLNVANMTPPTLTRGYSKSLDTHQSPGSYMQQNAHQFSQHQSTKNDYGYGYNNVNVFPDTDGNRSRNSSDSR